MSDLPSACSLAESASVLNMPVSNQLDFDLHFFRRLVARAPDYVDALWILSDLLSRRGYFDQALEVDRRLVQLRPGDPGAHYNLACSLALVGQPQQALVHLRQALQLGFDDPAQLIDDRDLDPLRQMPEFWALLDRFGITRGAFSPSPR